MTVTVPTGATFQPISVLNTTNGLLSYSSSPFKVTYAGGSITTSNFETKVDFAASTEALNMTLGDLDGDGKSDLVTANFSVNMFFILRITTVSGTINSSSFATKVDISTGTNPKGILMAILMSMESPKSLLQISIVIQFLFFVIFLQVEVSLRVLLPQKLILQQVLDLDEDDKPDLSIVNNTSNTVAILHFVSVLSPPIGT